MPSAVSLSSVTRPTPEIRFTGSAATKPATWSGVITNSPSGLRQSLATLARNLFGATPADTVMLTVSRTLRRIASAMRVALLACSGLSVTSRKASSRDSGSMILVKVRKMS